MFNVIPIWVVAAMLVVLVILCGEVGFRVGSRAKEQLGESPFAVLQAAVFGLLALLLAFSFSLGLQRYDSRRSEVLTEANSIGTTILRTQLLEPVAGQKMRAYLRDYIDARIAFAASTVDAQKRQDAARRSAQLQAQMWNLATAEASRDKHSTTMPLFIQSLNDTIDQSGVEAAVLSAHVPDDVIVVLAIVICFASVLLGVGFGRTDKRGVVAIALFALVIAIIVGTVLDLDRPQRGFIRVSLEPLESLRQPYGNYIPR